VSSDSSVSRSAASVNGPSQGSRLTFASARLIDKIGSRPVTIAIIGVFALQAAWVAVSARLVMYDEQYHLAAIKAFSSRWTPFIRQSTADGPVGDIERYGSYLYHYLLSFPYRAARAMELSDGATLVVLRIVSVLFVSGALAYAWRLFGELGAGPVTANVALAIVAMMPLTVFLAGALSYDNLLALLATAFLFYGLRLYKADEIDVGLWLRVLLVGGLAAVTKFSFLAIAPVIMAGLVFRQVPLMRSGLGPAVRGFFLAHPRGVTLARGSLAVAALLACALVVERYVLNLLYYGTPFPSCLAVHPASICRMYPVLATNYDLAATHVPVSPSLSGALTYLSYQWIPLMLKFLTYIGIVGAGGVRLTSYGPAIFGVLLTWSIPVAFGLVALSVTVLPRVRGARLLLTAAAVYTLVLFVDNYTSYAKLGAPASVQGRYILLVLPIIAGLACIAGAQLVTLGSASASARPIAAVCAVVMIAFAMSQGGGVTTYLWAGNAAWWRTDSGIWFAVTSDASQVVGKLVIPDKLVRDPRL
jgi:hypothetical protein